MSEPERDLTAPAIRRAEREGVQVSPRFRRQLRKLVDDGLEQNSEVVGVEREAELAVGRLIGEVIQIAHERDDRVADEELLQMALSSLCPLWPIC